MGDAETRPLQTTPVRPVPANMGYEALVHGRWVPCEIIHAGPRRWVVRIPTLADKRAVVVDPRGITITRRATQVRAAEKLAAPS